MPLGQNFWFVLFVQKLFSCFKWPLSEILGSCAGDLQRYDVINISGLNFMSRCYKNFHCTRYFIEFSLSRINHNIYYFVCRVTYVHSFENFTLKIRRQISKLQAVEIHMHRGIATICNGSNHIFNEIKDLIF